MSVFSEGSGFDDPALGLAPALVVALAARLNAHTLTKVQVLVLPVLLAGKDALVRARTGAGKTLAFAVPLVHRLQAVRPGITRANGPIALVVTPTRELALQTLAVLQKIMRPFVHIVPGAVTGGERKKSQKARLRKGINILVGTPGRLLDHIRSTACLSLARVQCVVLDEADRCVAEVLGCPSPPPAAS